MTFEMAHKLKEECQACEHLREDFQIGNKSTKITNKQTKNVLEEKTTLYF